MKCLKKKNIREFLDGEVTLKERGKIEGHLSLCPKCKKALKKTEEEIHFVKDQMECLAPLTIPYQIPIFAKEIKDKEKIRPSLKRLVLFPVRIPAFVLILMGVLILAMAVVLFSKNLKWSQHEFLRIPKSEESTLCISFEKGAQFISLDLDLSQFKPIEDPQIIVLREVGKYE